MNGKISGDDFHDVVRTLIDDCSEKGVSTHDFLPTLSTMVELASTRANISTFALLGGEIIDRTFSTENKSDLDELYYVFQRMIDGIKGRTDIDTYQRMEIQGAWQQAYVTMRDGSDPPLPITARALKALSATINTAFEEPQASPSGLPDWLPSKWGGPAP